MSERARSHGFTLIEVVVVVAILAIIATVVSAAAAVTLRSTSPTNDRVADSRSLHGLNTYLGRDAAATAPGDFDFDPGVSTGCLGPSPGTSLVRMTWAQPSGGGTVNFVANYRFVDQGGGEHVVERYACSGTGGGPYPNTVARNLTSALSATLPTVSPVYAGGPDVVGVEMTVRSAEGEEIHVDGDSRNPSATLPATTTTSTTITPTTTSTTTTSTTTTSTTSTTSTSTTSTTLVGP